MWSNDLDMDMNFRRMEKRDLAIIIAWLATPAEAHAWARDDFRFNCPMDMRQVIEDFDSAESRGLYLWTAVNAADLPVGMFSLKVSEDGTIGTIGQVLLNPLHRERHGHHFVMSILQLVRDSYVVDYLNVHVADHKVSTQETLMDYGFQSTGFVFAPEFEGRTLRLIELACAADALRLPTRPETTKVPAHAVRA